MDDHGRDLASELNALMATAGALSIGNGAMLYSPGLTAMIPKGPFASPVKPRNAPGRNNPCPCGSGKKYKRCCSAPTPPEPRP